MPWQEPNGFIERKCRVIKEGKYSHLDFRHVIKAPEWLSSINVRAELDSQRKLVLYGVGSLPEKFDNLFAEFAKNPRTVYDWFYKEPSFDEAVKMYAKLRAAWYTDRRCFPNKGTYKTVCRLFIKNLIRRSSKCKERLPDDIIHDSSDKSSWLSYSELRILWAKI